MALTIDAVKAIVLSSLLVATFLCGMVPVIFIRFVKRVTDTDEFQAESRMRQRNKLCLYKRALSFLSCFSAGVFLATCFLDLLPGVRENLIRALFEIKIYTGFPVAEFVMVVGLFLILTIEQIILFVKEGQSLSHEPQADENNVRQPLLLSDPILNEEDRDELAESIRSDHSLGGICDEPHVTQDHMDTAQHFSCRERKSRDRQRTYVSEVHTENGHGDVGAYQSQETAVHRDHSSHSQDRQHSPADHTLQVHSPLRAMLLLFALSLHSVFEGLTIGLQLSITAVLSVFAALSLHKSILSFSLGMNLVQSKISMKSTIKSIILFSMASPFGIAVGIGITDLWNSVTSGVVHGILQGIASGTFLYIIFFEILPKEFNCEVDRLLKVLFLILGYSVVTGILFLDNDISKPFCLINDKKNR